MRSVAKTKTEAALEAMAEAHADDPERAELLHRAKRFKASWLELAEALTRVRAGGQWRRWGYETFEDYAKGELHLRQETVDKLTGSYSFLKKRAPEVLGRDGVSAPIPSYQSIDFLRRAEERDDAPRDVVGEIRRQVFEDAAPAAALGRKFNEQVFPLEPAQRKARDAAALRNVAGRLRELLGETRAVPRRLAGEVGEALERLLEALAERDEEAA